MGDQGAGGIESNPTRRMSEAHTSSHEDQIQQPPTQTETPTAEDDERRNTRSGPRHSRLPIDARAGLSRNPSTSSTASGEGRRFFAHRQRPLEPPVTKATLSELDVTKIIHNPKLRHDINFDPELHFRPNLDGEKGKRKQEKANQFWTTLGDQLRMFIVNRDEFMRRFGNGEEWCLPLLLKSVKDIIQTLVPTRDRAYLDEGLNVDLIMQQFSKGMADLEKLASWLSGVLKSHCAPMRDEWVDQMYDQLTNGNKNNDMEELVNGLRSLLSVLEAMKLDVANHQIRCLRPILIEDTVHFEQRFFAKKIRDHKVDRMSAQMWYSTISQPEQPDAASIQAFGEMASFFEEMCATMFQSHHQKAENALPNSFLFDEERVVKLRTDMLDAINLEVCMQVYELLEPKYRQAAASATSAVPSPYLATPPSDPSSLSGDSTCDEGSEFDFQSSRPSSMVFSSAGSANSSPRSSLLMSAPPAPTLSAEEQTSKSRNLYSSLLALLQTSNASLRGAARWKAMQDSLALQIFRFTNAPTQDLLAIEQELGDHLSNSNSPIFKLVEQSFHQRLLTELQVRVKEFKVLTGVGLFSVATGARLQGPGRTYESQHEGLRNRDSSSSSRDARDDGGVEDMATRLAHLGLLHWRVWAPLVYVGSGDAEMTGVETPMSV
ncbi:T-complex protein 11 [Xylariomycetidae sp. FL0641]|nr:T-complex protein 11 [Xylariomycetidae sp. FL0641]